ncbi:MAG: hydratase [Aminobacteriaceae bacterium]
MVKMFSGGSFLVNGRDIVEDGGEAAERLRGLTGRAVSREEGRQGTIAYSILRDHNTSGSMEKLKLKFDALTSHDITYVGIIQTAKASGLERFPVPYVLTNCHNSLCAVGGTINEDDHLFGLSAAKKYGGIYVPAHMAVIHMYMREAMAGCGKMVLGSDSHTRYGALGTMAVGEGGGELVKQLLGQTYDLDYPRVVGVYLSGKPRPGVGPQDVALAIISAVFQCGYTKNSVMEFVGEGISNISADYRCGIDVMTTETACLSSIWRTDESTREFLEVHGRGSEYRELNPARAAYYDGMISVDMSSVRPMIALPFHPSNAVAIETFNENPIDILREVESSASELFGDGKLQFSLADKVENGRLRVEQGVIAGCAGGTFSNVAAAASILRGKSTGNGPFSLSVYPSSEPVLLELVKNGCITDLMLAGATIRTAFCGPCFGAGDVPANNGLSIRHTTRNFPNREGSKPGEGQIASVALMDARSIAATSANGGLLTPATDIVEEEVTIDYHFDDTPYRKRVFSGFGSPYPETSLIYGPNIADWPELPPLPEHILLKICSFITDPVTTTDELIPSGETASFRSNPLGLAEYTLSRKDPGYVARAKEVRAFAEALRRGEEPEAVSPELGDAFAALRNIKGFEDILPSEVGAASAVYAVKPGDGSAREQAASCQRVLGGGANIAREYATKRYRSNLINWGMVPFVFEGQTPFAEGSYIFVPCIRDAVEKGRAEVPAFVLGKGSGEEITLRIDGMTSDERAIILAGSLISFNRNR